MGSALIVMLTVCIVLILVYLYMFSEIRYRVLARRIGEHKEKGQYRKAIMLSEIVLKLLERPGIVDSEEKGDWLLFTAELCQDLEMNKRAIELYIKAENSIRGSRRQGSIKHADCLISLGIAYAEKGMYKESLENLEKGYKLKTELLGPRSLDVLEAALRLADVKGSSGDVENAENLFENTVEVIKEAVGGRGIDLGTATHQLAHFYFINEKYVEAKQKYEEAILILCEISGVEPERIAECQHSLGMVLYNLEEYIGSKSVLKESLEKYRLLKKKSSLEIARIQGDLLLVDIALGSEDFTEAEVDHCIKNIEKEVGNNIGELLDLHENLGRQYLRSEKYKKSAKHFIVCLRYLGILIDRTREMEIVNALASLYIEIGEYSKALKLLGEHRHDIDETKEMLVGLDRKKSLSLAHMGKVSVAIELLLDSLARIKNAASFDTKVQLEILLELGECYIIGGDFEEARKIYRTAESIGENCSDEKLKKVNIKGYIANLDRVEGKYEDARSKYETVIEGLKNEDDKNGMMLDYASLLNSVERFDESEALVHKVIDGMSNQNSFGLKMIVSLEELGWIALSKGRFFFAEEKFSKAIEMIKHIVDCEINIHYVGPTLGLSFVKQNLAEFAESGRLLDIVEKIVNSLFGMDSYNLLPVLHGRGLICDENEDWTSASRYFGIELDLIEKHFGKNSIHSVSPLIQNALEMICLGDFDESREMLQFAEMLCNKFCSKQNTYYADLFSARGFSDLRRGFLSEAKMSFSTATSIYTARLGNSHYRTLKSRLLDAIVLYAEGCEEDSLQVQKDVIKDAKRVFGLKHKRTRNFEKDLELQYRKYKL